MDDLTIKSIVSQSISRSDFQENAELHNAIRHALDRYFKRNRAAPTQGRSNATSTDVADAVEAITAELMPAFDFDEVALFDPNGAADVEQCNLESQICNRYLKVNNGRVEIQSAVRNALLLRNAILKVYVDRAESVNQERYEALSDIELMSVQAPTAPSQHVKITSIDRNDNDGDLTDVNLTRTTTFRRLTVEATDPANLIITSEWTSIFTDAVPLIGERTFPTRSELVRRGFPRGVVDALPATSMDSHTSSTAKNRTRQSAVWNVTGDKSQDRIETYELYMHLDVDNDGIAELRKIVYAGGASTGEILSNELWPFHPYACGTGFLIPNRFWGLSIDDKLSDIETMKTEALQQYEENLSNATWQELVVNDGITAMGDVKERKSAGVIRTEDVNQVKALEVIDTGPSSRAYLDYLDGVITRRIGAAVEMQSANFQIAGESAHGIERQMSTKEHLAQLICRTLGETLIAQTFRLIHRTLREFMPREAEFPVARDRFVTATPGEWTERAEVTVVAGMTHAERIERRATMDALLLQQEKLFEAGEEGVLMSRETYHNALIDWTKAGGASSPRRYWLDPREPAQQQALAAKNEAARAAADRQAAIENRLFETQVMIEDRKNATDVFKHATQLRFDYWNAELESQIEELRVEAQGSESVAPSPEAVNESQAEGARRASAGS